LGGGWVGLAGLSKNKANSACPAKMELELSLSMPICSMILNTLKVLGNLVVMKNIFQLRKQLKN
jgi:hypothetical protein